MLHTKNRRKGEGDSSGCGVVFFIIGVIVVFYLIAVNSGGGGPGGIFHVVKPPVPVVISHRDSLVGNGKVAIFSNQTANRLTLTVTFKNSKLNQEKTGTIDLEPNGKTEIGWLEGWKFVSGETITVSHPSYSPVTKVIP